MTTKVTPGHELQVGDQISYRGKTWIMRGWITAVRHLAMEADDGERIVISRHQKVEQIVG